MDRETFNFIIGVCHIIAYGVWWHFGYTIGKNSKCEDILKIIEEDNKSLAKKIRRGLE